MSKGKDQSSPSKEQDSLPEKLKTRIGFTAILIFLGFLGALVVGFVAFRLLLAQMFGEIIILVDLGSVIVLIIGAFTLSYLYYTRYVQREIIFTDNTFSLKVGKRIFEYEWDEFTVVALSISTSAAGIKGYTIRIYKDDLKGDYVELPIYRFPKSIDVFTLRNLLDRRIRPDLN